MKLFKKILLSLLLLLVVAAVGIYFWLQNLKPDYNAEHQLAGLKAPAQVMYDNFGIPHIYGQSEEDVFRAFGYVHAQDRLFQMEVLRRLAKGQLAEIFGKDALESDRFFRTLSFQHYAKKTLDSVYRDKTTPFMKAAQAYLDGVNDYIRNGKTPIEFTLVGIPKQEFTLEDMLTITTYMGYTFAEAFRTEAVVTNIYEKYGETYLKDFNSYWPANEPKIPINHTKPAPLASTAWQSNQGGADLMHFANLASTIEEKLPFPAYHGSNGWVISGSKTQSGKPILSNDTHIGFAQPSVWYEAHLECPGFQFYGNFIAGTPFGALGHNQHGGWGITMFENDDVDFFREKLNPQNANQVWYKDHWEELAVRQEVIKVKGGDDVPLSVKTSRHGILINEVDKKLQESKQPIALWWTMYQFPNRSLEVFYELAHARGVAQARNAVAKVTAPGLNFMWADTEGNIAWWAAAKLVKRPTHVNPCLILDGTTGNDDPLGWLDFDQNPQILNPERGVLYSANNQPDDMGTGLVSGYYVPGDRAKRIEQLLFNDKKDWSPEEVRKVINDVTNPNYSALLKDILPLFKPIVELEENKKRTPNFELGLGLLKNWDGSHDLTDVEPTIFYRFIYRLYEYAMRDELGDETFKTFSSSHPFKRNMAEFLCNDTSPWWDDITTPKVKEKRAQIMAKAYMQAIYDLTNQLGGQTVGWEWRKVHTLTHKHPLNVVPVIGKYFNVGPLEVPGGRETLNNLDFGMDVFGKYDVKYGPALRRIIDFGMPNNATSVNPTGQSGYFLSKHYDDQAKLFAESQVRTELMNKADIEKVKIGTMTLKP
ncbi:MAG: penicillin acylase family protein [Spirosomataceae bacterium]